LENQQLASGQATCWWTALWSLLAAAVFGREGYWQNLVAWIYCDGDSAVSSWSSLDAEVFRASPRVHGSRVARRHPIRR